MTITLTPAKACANLKANRHRIAAFQITRDTVKHCFYRYDGIGRPDLCCGVGATLDEADLDELARDGELMEPFDMLTLCTIDVQPDSDDENSVDRSSGFGCDLGHLQHVHDAVFEVDHADSIELRRGYLNAAIDEFLAKWSDK